MGYARQWQQQQLVMSKPDFFQNRPPFGQNRFLPVIDWLLSTDYRGTWAYAKERDVPDTPV